MNFSQLFIYFSLLKKERVKLIEYRVNTYLSNFRNAYLILNSLIVAPVPPPKRVQFPEALCTPPKHYSRQSSMYVPSSVHISECINYCTLNINDYFNVKSNLLLRLLSTVHPAFSIFSVNTSCGNHAHHLLQMKCSHFVVKF